MKKILTHSEDETRQLAAKLLRNISFPSVIAVHGDLGAGKSFLVRAMLRQLGVEGPIGSPTYNIIVEYELPEEKRVYHMDLYRIQGDDDALAFGIDEFFEDASALSFVEWSERLDELLPDETQHIYISHEAETVRGFELPETLCEGII